jgi:hypothetical protein
MSTAFGWDEDIRTITERMVNEPFDHFEQLETIAKPPRKPSSFKDRKWRCGWRRGWTQKDETLRTHRNPKALRHGKRKVFAGKYPRSCATLAFGEGMRLFTKDMFLRSGFEFVYL